MGFTVPWRPGTWPGLSLPGSPHSAEGPSSSWSRNGRSARSAKEFPVHKIRFEALPISDEIRKALDGLGFEEATPIQSLAIPPALEGRDLFGQAQTGTGKTAAFGIPILERSDPHKRETHALVLCPTRELAIQVAEELRRIASHKRGIDIVPVYGGQPIERQLYALRRGATIVVGTPGRVLDHLRRGTMKLQNLRMLVLDEADEMLDMGFLEDIEAILESTPAQRQTLLFSATMPKPILALTKKYQRDPLHLSVVHEQMTVPLVEQAYLEVREPQKLEVLSRLLDVLNPGLSLVFCNTKKGVDDLVAALNNRGYPAEGLHGDLKQVQRDRVMSRFRKKTVDILVATDVAARGIDVENIDIVFNYDVPWDEEDYVHRIGRTARAGRSGTAYTFVTGRDIRKLRDIQRFSGSRIRREQVPSQADVEESRATVFLGKVEKVLADGVPERHLRLAERLLETDATSVELLGALIRMTQAEDASSPPVADQDFPTLPPPVEMARLMLSVGRVHHIRPGDIVGALAGETGLPGRSIGAIRIDEQATCVEVPATQVGHILNVMKKCRIQGHPIRIWREGDPVPSPPPDRPPHRPFERSRLQSSAWKPPFPGKAAPPRKDPPWKKKTKKTKE